MVEALLCRKGLQHHHIVNSSFLYFHHNQEYTHYYISFETIKHKPLLFGLSIMSKTLRSVINSSLILVFLIIRHPKRDPEHLYNLMGLNDTSLSTFF